MPPTAPPERHSSPTVPAQQHLMDLLVHEIKTPLTVIALGSKALAQAATPAQSTVWQQRLQQAVADIVDTLDTCNQVSRFESGTLLPESRQFAPESLLSPLLASLSDATQTPATRIAVHYGQPQDAHLPWTGNTAYLHIILNNLLGNALKYAPPESPIALQIGRLQWADQPAQLQWAVRSAIGPAGVPDAALVFERHYRAPTASRFSGTGLGLWLSQQLALAMGSRIQMGQEGGQLVFWFTLTEGLAAAR